MASGQNSDHCDFVMSRFDVILPQTSRLPSNASSKPITHDLYDLSETRQSQTIGNFDLASV